MKQSISILFFLTWAFGMGYCQTQTSFVKIWGSYRSEEGVDIIPVSSGGYLMLGNQGYGLQLAGEYVDLFRLDENGDILWQESHLGLGVGEGRQLTETQDGGFILVGRATPVALGTWGDVWILKTDSEGKELWQLTLDSIDVPIIFEPFEAATCLAESGEGEIFVGGWTGDQSLVIVKCSKDGDLRWTLKDTTARFSFFGKIVPDVQGNFYLLSMKYIDSQFVPFVRYYNSNGSLIWERDLLDFEEPSTLVDGWLSPGGIQVLLNSNTLDRGTLVSVDPNSEVFAKSRFSIPFDSKILSGAHSNLGVWVAGETVSDNPPYTDLFLVHLDSVSRVISQEIFDFDRYDAPLAISPSGNGIIASGYVERYNDTIRDYSLDYLVARFNCKGEIQGLLESLGVYPNPFSQTLNIRIPNEVYCLLLSSDLSFRLFDVAGREFDVAWVLNTDGVQIDRGNLSEGIYFLEILSTNQPSYTTKILVQD